MSGRALKSLYARATAAEPVFDKQDTGRRWAKRHFDHIRIGGIGPAQEMFKFATKNGRVCIMLALLR